MKERPGSSRDSVMWSSPPIGRRPAMTGPLAGYPCGRIPLLLSPICWIRVTTNC